MSEHDTPIFYGNNEEQSSSPQDPQRTVEIICSSDPRKPSRDPKQTKTTMQSFLQDWNWPAIFYLSIFSTMGVTARAFLGRFFGGDCDLIGDPINDWLYPISHNICITATGRTDQHGGALFIDLPANILGSFVMGIMTGIDPKWPVIPWLSHDHPLQQDSGFHVGVRTALCGATTTFSSWNCQMVLMMDGTANPYLGSQVGAALFGYLIGLQGSIASFRAGRTLAAWFHVRTNPHVFEVLDRSGNENSSVETLRTEKGFHCNHIHHPLMARIIPSALAVVLVVLYLLGDFYWSIPYYRRLWIACLVAPFGTITRWKLSTLNGKLKYPNLQWFPLGTFLANFIGSIVSAAMYALSLQTSYGKSPWELSVIKAISLGFAGSLSTVSTFVKEIVELGEKNPHFDKKSFLYWFGTIASCCMVALLVYCPIVRLE